LINTYTIKTIKNLPSIDSTSLILVDIDDTVITPVSNLFRHNSEHKNIIDKIKEAKNQNYKETVSIWRLNRKVMLVEEQWKEFISYHFNQTYALTKMDIGKFGQIDSVENWRYMELKNLGISFQENFNDTDNFLISKNDSPEQGSFDRGIFYTGKLSKGDILCEIHKINPITKLIFIDDKISNINDITDTCKQLNISCDAYFYEGINMIDGDITNIQAENLIYNLTEKQIWNDEL
jgi:hypothetical protein